MFPTTNPLPSNEDVGRMIDAPMLSMDLETEDPLLETQGPGTQRGDGFICGMSVGVSPRAEDNWYIPVNHPDVSEEDRRKNWALIKDIAHFKNPKIGANMCYDLEWLDHYDISVAGKINDVQYAEPLLNEYAGSYALSKLALKYSVNEKQTSILKDYADHMGWKGKPIKHIAKMPSAVAGAYARTDTSLPLEIWSHQKRHLERQNLMDVYEMEIALIPLLRKMRRVGVRLDLDRMQRTIMEVTDRHYGLKERIWEWAGTKFNVNSSPQIAALFDREGIPYPRKEPTEKMKKAGKPGNPNIDKFVLAKLAEDYAIAQDLLDYRHYNTLISLFLSKYSEFKVDDRLFCEFHPLRNDKWGTVAGRFSSSKPNLQQVSADDEEEDAESDYTELKGKIVRALFIPEDGCLWAKADYSQIEYRIMAHYAIGRGSDELRRRYNDDKKTDFHQVIMDLTSLDRRPAKRLNFGGMFGMGAATAAEKFGWELDYTEMLMAQYHGSAPYIKKTRNAVSKRARQRGFIYTILGRKARTHPSRSLYSMFNRLIQGSAADIMKKGMVDAWDAGVFDVLYPHLTVHDEMDVSVPDTKIGFEALDEMQHCMENAVDLDVPIFVDVHTGRNWAEAD